ncbi:MAG: hypothetical protein L0Y56_13105, partial [Nitrospira sp.]|nr:hypothetical protein [Nitrospira sp.]
SSGKSSRRSLRRCTGLLWGALHNKRGYVRVPCKLFCREIIRLKSETLFFVIKLMDPEVVRSNYGKAK